MPTTLTLLKPTALAAYEQSLGVPAADDYVLRSKRDGTRYWGSGSGGGGVSSWNDLEDKPTTLSGFGITDAVSTSALATALGNYLTTAAAADAYQAKHANLTAISALSVASFGLGLLTKASATEARSTLELGSAALSAASAFATAAQGAMADSAVQPSALTSALANYQPINAGLTAISSLSTTNFGRSLLTQADAAAARTALGLGNGATLAINVANGLATLDSGGKISTTYLPDVILGQVRYLGTWDAATNSPTLPSASTAKGAYYIVSVAGTYNSVPFEVGDWVISDGSAWDKVDNTDAISSFAGRTGAIVPVVGDYSAFYQPLSTTLTSLAALTTTSFGRSLLTQADAAAVCSAVGLGNVENTKLSTWTGSSAITTLGTIASGTWNGSAIANGYIASALTGKTYNGLTLTSLATGFTISGGTTTSKTLTVSGDVSLNQSLLTTSSPILDSLTISAAKAGAYNYISITNTSTTGYAQLKLSANSVLAAINWAPTSFLKVLTSDTSPITFETNGVERLRISGSNGDLTASGNIVLSGGSGKYVSWASDGSSHFLKYDSTLNGLILNGYGGLKFQTNGADRITVLADGGVCIGTSGRLATGAVLNSVSSGNSFGACIKSTPTSDATYAPLDLWNTLEASNTYQIQFRTGASGITRGDIRYNSGTGQLAYNTTSDYRAKVLKGPFSSSDIVDRIPVYIGRMKDGTEEMALFVAHEVQAVCPWAVSGEKDAMRDGKPLHQQLDKSGLIPVMWAELQSVRRRLSALEAA